MYGINHLLSFVFAASLIIVVPGPATVYVTGKATRSIRDALLALAGIVAGDAVLITLAGLGFAAVAARWPSAVTAIKVLGALYVAYLGSELLRAPAHTATKTTAVPAPYTFAKGLMITLTNPKPLLFFAMFFPLFIDPATSSRIASFYVLGMLFEAINLLYFSAVLVVVVVLRRAQLFGRYAAGTFNRVSGAALVLCAGLLLASALA